MNPHPAGSHTAAQAACDCCARERSSCSMAWVYVQLIPGDEDLAVDLALVEDKLSGERKHHATLYHRHAHLVPACIRRPSLAVFAGSRAAEEERGSHLECEMAFQPQVEVPSLLMVILDMIQEGTRLRQAA